MSKESILLFVLFISSSFIFLSCKDRDNATVNWKSIGTTIAENGSAYNVSVDLKSIEFLDDEKKSFWVKFDTLPQNRDDENFNSYTKQMTFWQVGCKDKSLTRLAEELYDSDSVLLTMSEEVEKVEYEPNTIGEKIANYACSINKR